MDDKNKIARKPIIGMRIIKTVIAVGIAAVLMRYVFDINPFFACIGAVVAVESTVANSIKASLIRNVGTIIGGVTGILFASFTNSIVLYSLGIIPMILVSKAVNKKESIVPGAIVYFAVCYLNTFDTAWLYGARRIFGTFIGTLVGLAVNFLLFPPKHEHVEQENANMIKAEEI